MKKQIAAFLSAAVLIAGHSNARAEVILSNLDPAEFGSTGYGENLGQSVITGGTPISLTSVEFPQIDGPNTGDALAIYSRNADGTLGTELFSGFMLTRDSASSIISATVAGAFTLQANTGYWFVLSSPDLTEWDFTPSAGYSSQHGVNLPELNTSYVLYQGTTYYFNLSQGEDAGPDMIQVNGQALPVPEPSTAAFVGLACAWGVVLLLRRRTLAA